MPENITNIGDIVNLQSLAVFYERKILTLPPYLTESYFPSIKIATDVLQYLSSTVNAPHLAASSKYDASPKPSNRKGFGKEIFSTNFFRTASAVNEKDLEDINRAFNDNDDSLMKSLIVKLFDDKSQELLNHRARREWMGMQALMNGEIKLKSNGVTNDVIYPTDEDFQSEVATYWTDTANSNPIKDLRNALDDMRKKGQFPNQVLMNTDTFRLIQDSESVKASLYMSNANAAKMQLTEGVVVDWIKSQLHVTPVVYDQGFIDEEATGTLNFTPFVPDGKVVLLSAPIPSQFALAGTVTATAVQPAQVLGHMSFAPTPEELGARAGRIDSNSVQILDTGVAYHECFNQKLVQSEDLVSMNCLPSFEGSKGVYRLTVTKQPDTATTDAGTTSGDTGASK